jgi:hypothetical protein
VLTSAVLTSAVPTSAQKSRSNFRGANRGHEHTVKKGSRRSAVRKPNKKSRSNSGLGRQDPPGGAVVEQRP